MRLQMADEESIVPVGVCAAEGASMAPKAAGKKLARGRATTTKMTAEEKRERQKLLRHANVEHTNALARVRHACMFHVLRMYMFAHVKLWP
jgi:hypothetical protein